ncbi:hypothetical protein EMCRGX_G013854 [Ephydatia muelleri]
MVISSTSKCDSKASYGYETHKMCADSVLSLQRVFTSKQTPVNHLLSSNENAIISNNRKILGSIIDTCSQEEHHHHDEDTITVQEDFVGFVDVTGHTTGEDIASTILKRLVELNLDVNLLRGQRYDGSGIYLPIKWVERHDANEVFIDLYSQIVDTLTTISGSTGFNAETTKDATALLAAVTKFEFIITLYIVGYIMGYMKQLSVHSYKRYA